MHEQDNGNSAYEHNKYVLVILRGVQLASLDTTKASVAAAYTLGSLDQRLLLLRHHKSY